MASHPNSDISHALGFATQEVLGLDTDTPCFRSTDMLPWTGPIRSIGAVSVANYLALGAVTAEGRDTHLLGTAEFEPADLPVILAVLQDIDSSPLLHSAISHLERNPALTHAQERSLVAYLSQAAETARFRDDAGTLLVPDLDAPPPLTDLLDDLTSSPLIDHRTQDLGHECAQQEVRLRLKSGLRTYLCPLGRGRVAGRSPLAGLISDRGGSAAGGSEGERAGWGPVPFNLATPDTPVCGLPSMADFALTIETPDTCQLEALECPWPDAFVDEVRALTAGARTLDVQHLPSATRSTFDFRFIE